MTTGNKTFVVAASRSLAHFYAMQRPSLDSLESVATIHHEEGRLKDSEIVTDQPGRVRDGHASYGLRTDVSPSETEADRFAKDVAEMIRRARLNGGYRDALVIAGPAFLGMIREHLHDADQDFIRDSIPKNVAQNEDQVRQQVRDYMS